MGKTIGLILIAGGIIVGIIITALILVYKNDGLIGAGGAALGITLGLLVLVLPQLGFGAFLFWRGVQETAVTARAQEQRKLLDIVKAQGQIGISDLVIELNSSRDNVQQQIYQLVGMGLFSGYINWDEGMLYSRQATDLRQLSNCEYCNGKLELAGKGIIRCPFCGTEYFLES
ncbi:hypothetical protein MNBD_CHLOROFLEXI01-4599 [hydrothermal vent metagenome]|uniref:Uncharacterized protein n=1 Tax=hydrothermal vent metagenome TaxID=652676 RepID=A0A3B0UXJ3_9ZZZZ